MGYTEKVFWGLVTILSALLIYLVIKVKRTREYYRKHGITYVGPNLGSTFRFMTGMNSLIELEVEYFQQATAVNAPLVGLTDFFGTSTYITDLNVIKAICVQNFDHFVNRRPIKTQQTNKYLKRMLFFSQSQQWKGNRAKLSPIFTTGKLKKMFQIFSQSSTRMENYLKEQMNYPAANSMDIDFQPIFSKYSMDVIASCAFGIDSKSFEMKPTEKSIFERMGSNLVFKFTPLLLAKFLVMISAPKLADTLGIDLLDKKTVDYFSGTINNVMKHRRQTGQRREDFLQLMMDVQAGILKADEESNQLMNGTANTDDQNTKVSGLNDETKEKLVILDDDHIIANTMLFLMAGFDGSQSGLLFSVYTLALEQGIQEKLYKEVKSVVEKNGGTLTYDAISEMKYLDMFFNETLRVYSPGPRAERLCTKDYVVPGTDILIEKGSTITIPIHGVHRDPRHFPNPNKFIPERFTPENKATRHPYAYMVFGHGPRNCIGNRFALIKVKLALAQLVQRFQFAPCSKTTIPMKYDRSSSLKPKYGMWLNITVRRDT